MNRTSSRTREFQWSDLHSLSKIEKSSWGAPYMGGWMRPPLHNIQGWLYMYGIEGAPVVLWLGPSSKEGETVMGVIVKALEDKFLLEEHYRLDDTYEAATSRKKTAGWGLDKEPWHKEALGLEEELERAWETVLREDGGLEDLKRFIVLSHRAGREISDDIWSGQELYYYGLVSQLHHFGDIRDALPQVRYSREYRKEKPDIGTTDLFSIGLMLAKEISEKTRRSRGLRSYGIHLRVHDKQVEIREAYGTTLEGRNVYHTTGMYLFPRLTPRMVERLVWAVQDSFAKKEWAALVE